MIGRLTIVAVAVALGGSVCHTAQAQGYPQYAATPAGYMAGGQDNANGGCASCTEGTCTDDWFFSGRNCGAHHPNCSCPRCHPRHVWASFDSLMWWGKPRSTPALVTSDPNGVLPNSTLLFGGGTVGGGMAPGARADFGLWFDDCETLGMGAKVWGLHGDSEGFYAASPTGDTVLARPFYNVVLDQEDALLASSPGLIVGSIDAHTASSVISAEAYLRSGVLSGRGYNVDLIGGYHFLRLDDDLSVFSDSMSIDPSGAVPVGTVIDVLDVFGTKNEFHGGSLGMVGEVRHGAWTVSGLAKVSVGNMHESVTINGYQSITAPGDVPAVSPGGVFAQPTNMGTYERDVIAWIPEFGVSAGYDVRSWLRLTVGYNVLWMSNVALSGNQIDRGVNPTQFAGNPLIGPARPAFTGFQESEYFLHGITLGAVFMY
jgi:hypothetical protein